MEGPWVLPQQPRVQDTPTAKVAMATITFHTVENSTSMVVHLLGQAPIRLSCTTHISLALLFLWAAAAADWLLRTTTT